MWCSSGVGFETTAPPANAMSVVHAQRLGADELLAAGIACAGAAGDDGHLVLADQPGPGFPRAGGHVCTVMGTSEYGPLVAEFGIPIVVSGFEPLDLLEGVRQLVDLLEDGKAELRNAYPPGGHRGRESGGPADVARRLCGHRPIVARYRHDRKIGLDAVTALRGVRRREEVRGVGHLQVAESAECHSGEVLQGLLKPNECPAFGKSCTPRTPLGATMVSSEGGACAAYYQFRRLDLAHV